MEEGDGAAEWGDGLPALEELMPLTQSLITPDLASAFSITQEETAAFLGEVQFATQSTFNSVGPLEHLSPLEAHLSLQRNHNSNCVPQLRPEIGLASTLIDGKEIVPETGLVGQGPSTLLYGNSPGHGDGSPLPSCMTFNALERIDNGCGVDTSESSKKPRKQLDTEFEDGESGGGLENSSEEPTARTLKRPRLVWTPQLHKRFVDAVAHLGIKNAVPKTIMQLMNVEGLTRENVASHLQKYRLYLKRMQGLSSDGPSVSDQLFASTPIPPSLAASAHFLSNHNRRDDIVPLMVPVPIAALGHGHMVGTMGAAAPYPGFDHHVYNAFARSSTHTFSSGDEDSVMENQVRSRSPQRRVLTLFPTNGH